MKEKKVIWGVFILSLVVWLINVVSNNYPVIDIWIIRKELTYLTGIISFTFMGLIMLLAVRPKWLENAFHGLDKMYYIHKWAGIYAIAIAGVHYLITLSGSTLILFFERGAKGPRIETFLSQFRSLAKTLGEQSIWMLIIALVITLWHFIPYNRWRFTHKLMGLLFLFIVFHTIVLAPTSYWLQPVGFLFIVVSIVGSICALISLFGGIGKRARFESKVIDVQKLPGDVLELTCQLNRTWQHKAGQYAFIYHDFFEGGHPFTISSDDQHNNQIRFSIKSLGDYTRKIQNSIKVGDDIKVEGPYGRFDYQTSQSDRQIWIGGGIGVTPFISWLENLHKQTDNKMPVDLFYCIKNQEEAIFVPRLKELCARLTNVTLHIHYSDEKGFLTFDKLPFIEKGDKEHYTDIWFCGPTGFATALKSGLGKVGFPVNAHFHQEYFQMR